jgi:FeS assembly SUF system protein
MFEKSIQGRTLFYFQKLFVRLRREGNFAKQFVNEMNIRDKIIQAIKEVYDPEIPVDVYELGLIYEINIFEATPEPPTYNVHILMTLTSPACPSAGELPGYVVEKVDALPEVKEVILDLTFEPPYTSDMMSEAARLELGFM